VQAANRVRSLDAPDNRVRAVLALIGLLTAAGLWPCYREYM